MAWYMLVLFFLSPCLCVPEDFVHHSFGSLTRLKDLNCTTAGYRCSLDCKKLEVCINKGNELVSVDVDVCTSEELCDSNIKGCSRNLTTCPVPFICTSEGIFPDPYDCTKFHMCVSNSQDIQGTCDYGYAFDVTTGECSLKTTDNPTVCRHALVPTCNYDGQSGPLEWSAKYYYKCEDNIPLIYKCETGEFDSVLLKCVSAVSPTQSTTTSAIPSSCKDSTLYTDPADCSSYYLCKQGFAPQHKHCPSGTDFNPVLQMCLSDSRVCQTSSHYYPTTCESAGLYPDLLNCNFYYLCLQGTSPKHEHCLLGSHFDSDLRICVLGSECN